MLIPADTVSVIRVRGPYSPRWLLNVQACSDMGCRCHSATHLNHGRTHCPACEGEPLTLDVYERNGRIVARCRNGCSAEQIQSALAAGDLWPVPRQTAQTTSPPHRHIPSPSDVTIERLHAEQAQLDARGPRQVGRLVRRERQIARAAQRRQQTSSSLAAPIAFSRRVKR
jgi:hypothetical protein